MNNSIEQIEITNFRSIKYAKIDCSAYNLFCGQNDVGKSNVLKALNLFFNQETDFNTSFNFLVDYNKYALAEAQSSKKGKQFIRIKVTFKTPTTYTSIKQSSFSIEKTYDRNDKTGIGTIKYSEDSKQARSAISRLYNKIKYVYIPALKGKDVIQYLLGLLGEQQLIGKTQIEDLNNSINETTKDLSELLNKSNIGIGVTFGLPTLLSDFWQQLSVGTTYEYTQNIENRISIKNKKQIKLNISSYQIPLTMRGDGIKSQFLPPILQWLQKHNKQQIFIWGIDEPENSLEFKAAERFSTLFCDEYAKVNQIFATSHSMAFINPRETAKIKPTIFRTRRTPYGETELINININLFENTSKEELLEELGSLEIQKELIEKYRQKIESEENAQKELKNSVKELQSKITELTKPLIITEGKTDIKHILKAKSKLHITDIDFDSIKEDHQPDGDQYLSKLLEQLSKIPNKNKVIGIFDRDNDSIIAKIEENQQPFKEYGNGVYAFCISPPQSRIDKGQEKISIEYLYSDAEIKAKLNNGCRLFFGTEFTKESLRHNEYPNLILKNPTGKSQDKIIENNKGQAVLDENETNVLAKKNDFAEAVKNDNIQICNDSWENFRHIFDKITIICSLIDTIL